VLERAVEQGQTVAASFSTPTLFTIANDLTKMKVEADVDEADIGQVKLGQPVTFTVDAFPDDTFQGTVQQIRLQPTVTSNVVTYTVIIDAPNPDEKLYPGMTANVTISTQAEEGIVVPMEALNFNPASDASQPKLPQTQSVNGNGKKHVWVLNKNGNVKENEISKKEITTGLSDGVNAIVKEGLNEGDEVVLSVFTQKKSKDKAASNPLMPSRPGGRR